MKLIKSTTFTNSFTYEHLATIAVYQSEIGYEIYNKIGAKSEGVIRPTRMTAEDYYLELINDTKKGLYSIQIPFHTK